MTGTDGVNDGVTAVAGAVTSGATGKLEPESPDAGGDDDPVTTLSVSMAAVRGVDATGTAAGAAGAAAGAVMSFRGVKPERLERAMS